LLDDVAISAGQVGFTGGPQAYGERIEVSVNASQLVTLTCGHGIGQPYEDAYQGLGARSCSGDDGGLVLERSSPTTFEGR
jgi:hypothetical protein